MFKKRLETVFIAITLISIAILANNWYSSHLFNTTPIPDEYKQQIADKEQEVLQLMQKNYGITLKVPLIITDKIDGKQYGITSYNNGDIKIYLNKKVMKESLEYIVDDVIAHEYAHALMFKQGVYERNSDGHTPQWQKACQKLGGSRCDRYVNHNDVIMGKMPF
ncbi:MAG: SprT-like domain-containing protein [Campylobacterota bacterium]|nr:SprT-like domain-containing protein [Campylobacterota bacterium]